ncbi:hypothetical protein GCM10010140_01270 [Streptosporangium pseudovulgare]|uniref:Uncharacterized protein n=1 Tax=Streptosporangium pseudovulgare TaxID=35765 RepID=A0ABQ2QDL0_9ACTN|nr:hypothetical protein GCM10010140_01270 [Streptosporangium pseudovulgare]
MGPHPQDPRLADGEPLVPAQGRGGGGALTGCRAVAVAAEPVADDDLDSAADRLACRSGHDPGSLIGSFVDMPINMDI